MSSASRRIVGHVAASVLVVAFAVLVVLVVNDSGDRGGESTIAVTGPGKCGAAGNDADMNRQVRLTTTGDAIEFELWSSEPFPVRALIPVVRIGTRDYPQSRYADDGELNTLIFSIPREDLDLLSPDDFVSVYYGGGGTSPPPDSVPETSAPWSFGGFAKDLLDCAR